MNFRQAVVIFLVTFIASCTNKISFESEDKIEISEAYYESWTSGVKGGGSGLNIYIILKDRESIKLKSIDIKGIYFEKRFCDLKQTSKNKFQGFIKTESNTQVIEPTLKNEQVSQKEESKEKFPFELDEDQAVLTFMENGKRKYYKLKLKRKELNNFPM